MQSSTSDPWEDEGFGGEDDWAQVSQMLDAKSTAAAAAKRTPSGIFARQVLRAIAIGASGLRSDAANESALADSGLAHEYWAGAESLEVDVEDEDETEDDLEPNELEDVSDFG